MQSRDAQFQKSMLDKAAKSLMIRDLSDRAYAERYLALAAARRDGNALSEGLARLEAYFIRQPQTRELNTLISWYGRLGDSEKVEVSHLLSQAGDLFHKTCFQGASPEELNNLGLGKGRGARLRVPRPSLRDSPSYLGSS
ncbi:MAG: hypothetical protein MZU95_07565 [Desulfomicrobium escambiense]|nr:hypothetical protein [Desulfomicrobium escambiense]